MNRLVWASTQASGSPCGRTGSEGIANASYTASYNYDNLNDITSASVVDGSGNPLANTAQGSYSYNTANAAGHLHAVSSVGSGSTGYSAAYDVAGDMTCRAIGSLSCTTTGSPTGQVLSYDALRRLISWQNASSLPTATAAYAYDGEGNRVWQQSVSGPGGAQTTTTTTTLYLLGHDEQTTTQVSGQQATVMATRYYPTPGGALAVRDATGFSYLATDHLGTPIATVNLDTGALLGEQLRAPYGEARYSASANTPSGGMHTTVGFTGQREDQSGLSFFHARYYDTAAGRFVSAETALTADPALDGYAYVGGMVESTLDPSGHRVVTETDTNWFSSDQEGALLYSDLLYNPDAAFYLYLTDRHDWNIAEAYATGVLHTYDLQTTTGRGALNYRMSHSASYFADPAHGHELLAAVGAESWLVEATTGSTHDGHQDFNHEGGKGYDAGDGGDDGLNGLGSGISGDVDGIRGYADGRGGDGCGESFTPTTVVQTPTGQQAISSLKPGNSVEAYDPTTGKTSKQTVERVYIDHDHDLLDVTLRVQPSQQPNQASSSNNDETLRVPGRLRQHAEMTGRTTVGSTGDETVHTTASHPWLTADQGWVRAGQLTLGEQVRRADGATATVVALHVVPGAADMWDLTVSNIHTFAVGAGAYVVHNCGDGVGDGSGDPTGSGTGDGSGDPTGTGTGAYPPGSVEQPGVPSTARDTVEYARDNGGATRPGYVGGKPYHNDGRGGGQLLPDMDISDNAIAYREYDVNPLVRGVNRGKERVVIGSNGSAWYTNNHYTTFTLMVDVVTGVP